MHSRVTHKQCRYTFLHKILTKFSLQVCPDDVKEEAGDSVFYNTIIGLDGDSQETLTCRATWTSDLNDKETFMMGTLDYR